MPRRVEVGSGGSWPTDQAQGTQHQHYNVSNRGPPAIRPCPAVAARAAVCATAGPATEASLVPLLVHLPATSMSAKRHCGDRSHEARSDHTDPLGPKGPVREAAGGCDGPQVLEQAVRTSDY